MDTALDILCVHTIRTLATDAVQGTVVAFCLERIER